MNKQLMGKCLSRLMLTFKKIIFFWLASEYIALMDRAKYSLKQNIPKKWCYVPLLCGVLTKTPKLYQTDKKTIN